MATGPDHFREAERLAARAAKDSEGHIGDHAVATIRNMIALAQVHATLAHAAATALVNETEKNLSHDSTGAVEYRAWQHAANRQP